MWRGGQLPLPLSRWRTLTRRLPTHIPVVACATVTATAKTTAKATATTTLASTTIHRPGKRKGLEKELVEPVNDDKRNTKPESKPGSISGGSNRRRIFHSYPTKGEDRALNQWRQEYWTPFSVHLCLTSMGNKPFSNPNSRVPPRSTELQRIDSLEKARELHDRRRKELRESMIRPQARHPSHRSSKAQKIVFPPTEPPKKKHGESSLLPGVAPSSTQRSPFSRLSNEAEWKFGRPSCGVWDYENWGEVPSAAKEKLPQGALWSAAQESPLVNSRRADKVDEKPLRLPPLPEVLDTTKDFGQVAVTAIANGPAESFRRRAIHDPILRTADLLARKYIHPNESRSSPQIRTNIEQRFRACPPGPARSGPEVNDTNPDKAGSRQKLHEQRQESSRRSSGPESGISRGSLPLKNTDHIVGDSMAPEAALAQSCKKEVKGLDSQPNAPLSMSTKDCHKTSSETAGPDEMAQSDRPIFDWLFRHEHKSRDKELERTTERLKSTFSAVQKGVYASAKAEEEIPVRPPPSDSQVFGQLFPEEVESESEWSMEEEMPDTMAQQPVTLPEDSLLVSLRNEVRNWIPEDQRAQITGPLPREPGSQSTVIVMSGLSPSLIDTDFYRIAPEGQHVEGWAGGLVKVVQARDSINQEPLGKYYLMFVNRPSAQAYVIELTRLHALSRRLLHRPADSGWQVAKGPLDHAPTTPQPFLSNQETAAVRSFTLCSPGIQPKISVRMWNTKLVQELAAQSTIADVLQTLRPEAETPARVLLKITSPDGDRQSGLTTDELWQTMRDDGRERSAPWVLANLSNGIMPVKCTVQTKCHKVSVSSEPVAPPFALDKDSLDEEGDEDFAAASQPVLGTTTATVPSPRASSTGSEDPEERFHRFILTFTHAAVARRFVRCWHKRMIHDGVLERTVVVDAVGLM